MKEDDAEDSGAKKDEDEEDDGGAEDFVSECEDEEDNDEKSGKKELVGVTVLVAIIGWQGGGWAVGWLEGNSSVIVSAASNSLRVRFFSFFFSEDGKQRRIFERRF